MVMKAHLQESLKNSWANEDVYFFPESVLNAQPPRPRFSLKRLFQEYSNEVPCCDIVKT